MVGQALVAPVGGVTDPAGQGVSYVDSPKSDDPHNVLSCGQRPPRGPLKRMRLPTSVSGSNQRGRQRGL